MKRGFLTALVLCAAVTVSAQEQTKLILTLDEAIEIALNENPTIKIADMEIQRQDYVRKETIGNHLPSLSASGQYIYAIEKQKMSRSGLSFGADNTITLGGSLSVPLFVPAVYASLGLNKAQMDSAVESARSSKINMVNEVKKAYYNMLLLEESLTVLKESEKLIQETVDNTRLMYESELASEYDLLTAEVSLSNLQPTIIEVSGALDVSNFYMRMLLSIPEDIDIEVVGSLDAYSDEILNWGGYHSTDISNNSDLRQIDIQAKMLESQIKLINSQRMPTIAAFGQVNVAGNDMPDINFISGGDDFTLDPTKYPVFSEHPDLGLFLMDVMEGMGGGNKEPETGFWWQYPVNVGVSISIPIFSGNKVNNQIKQTRIAQNQLALQREYVEQATTLQLQSSLSTLRTSREKMYANAKAAEQAKKAYDITSVRYNAGAGTILELSSAELQYTQARLNYTQAIYEYLAAQADYEKIIGQGF